MFVLGLVIGACFIGAPLGLFITALCVGASRADERMERDVPQ